MSDGAETAEFSKSFEAMSLKRHMRKLSEEGSCSPLSGDASSLSSGEFEIPTAEQQIKGSPSVPPNNGRDSTDSPRNKSEKRFPWNSKESPRDSDNVFEVVLPVSKTSSLSYPKKTDVKAAPKVDPKPVASWAKASQPPVLKPKPAIKPKPAVAPKPKPEIPTKPKTNPKQVFDSRPGMSDRRGSFEKKIVDVKTASGSMRIELETISDDYSEVEPKESSAIPQKKGVKGISSMFESKKSDAEIEAMYAKPIKSSERKRTSDQEEHVPQVEMEENEEAPPPTPPRLYDENPTPSPDSPYNDPGPPNFRPPPPPGSSVQTNAEPAVIINESPGAEEDPYSEVIPVATPEHEQLSPYSNVDVVSKIPTPPPGFKDAHHSPDRVKGEDLKVNSIYEGVELSVNPSRQQVPSIGQKSPESRALTPTSEEVSRIHQFPPQKPLPYKPKGESVPPPLPKQRIDPAHGGTSDGHPLSYEVTSPTALGSPQYAVVMPGSPRLASAEIKSTASPNTKNGSNFKAPPPIRDTSVKPGSGVGSWSSSPSSSRPSPPPPMRVSSLKGSPTQSPVSSRNSPNTSPLASDTPPIVPPLNLNEIIHEEEALISPDDDPSPPASKPAPLPLSQSALLPRAFGSKPRSPPGSPSALIKELMARNNGGNTSLTRSDASHTGSSRDSVDKMICPPPPKFSPIPSRRIPSESSQPTSEHVNVSNLDSFIIPPPPPSSGPPSPGAEDIGFDFLSSEEPHPSAFTAIAAPPSQTSALPNFSHSNFTSNSLANPVAVPALSSVGLGDLDELPSRDTGATVSGEVVLRPLVPPMRKQR